MLKSAISAGTTSDVGWAAELAPMRQISEQFLQSLEPFSAIDKIIAAGNFRRAPMHAKISVVTVGATGGVFGERQTKTPTKLELETSELRERKVASFVACTEDLLKFSGALSLLSGELRRAVARVSDEVFLTAISEVTGAYSTPGTGTSAAQIASDVGEALEHLTYGSDAKLYLIASPKYVKAMAMARGTAGAPAFPGVGCLGGDLQGITVVCSDAAQDSAYLIDASQVLCDPGIAVLDSSSEATLQLNDTPTDGEAVVTSLFQFNMRALKVERVFGLQVTRPEAASVISGVTA